MESTQSFPVNGGAEHSWDHIWVLDALFAVLLRHIDDVATTTMKDGFSMDFRKNGTSICALDHFQNRHRTLFVNVAVGRELWFALCGIAHENKGPAQQ
jgi:hypothetical protein